MTTIKLNTKMFASLLSRAAKCSLKNSVDMLAELIEIKLKDGVLSLRTTDTRNTLVLRMPNVTGDDFSAVISVTLFEKIVNKTTKEEIELCVDDTAVTLKGNGTYKFARPIEGNQHIEFSSIPLISEPDIRVEMKLADIRNALKYNGNFVGSVFVDPTIAGFYFGENVVTTDGYNACFLKTKFFENDVMLYESTVNLLDEFDGDSVVFLKKGKHVQFYNSTALLNTVDHQETENFPNEELSKFLEDTFESGVTISVKEAQSVLDRVMLFVDGRLGSSAAILSFEESGIVVTDKGGSVNEIISYKNPVNFKPFTCKVSAPDFNKALNIDVSDDIILRYGNEISVRLDVGDVTRILALVPDEEDTDISAAFSEEAQNISEETEIGDEPPFDLGAETADTADSLSNIEW